MANTVSGTIFQSETAVGIPGLLVVVHDVATAPLPEGPPVAVTQPVAAAVEPSPIPPVATTPPVTTAPPVIPTVLPVSAAPPVSAPEPSPGPVGIVIFPPVQLSSLGSATTDANGQFSIQYDDGLFTAAVPGRIRPSLSVSVLAPESVGVSLATRTLFQSADLRVNAAPDEAYQIAIPAATLTAAGVPIPLGPAAAQKQPQPVIDDMQQAVAYQQAVTMEKRSLAAAQVTTLRTNTQQLDSTVATRFLESLTGMTADEAARLRVVPSGTAPQPTVWNTVNNTIQTTVNTSSMVGYVVFSADEAAKLKDPSGNYQQNIAAAQIEPYIFQADDANRPMTILRSDPVATQCRARSTGTDPFAPGPAVPPAPALGGTAQPTDTAITSADLPKFIGRLVAPMVAPEETEATLQSRPTAADVQSSVTSLQFGAGPADVTAFYDFLQLQIAFDYVWQQAIDSGIIDTAKALCRQLVDQGGDPVAALQPDGDPVAALRSEVRHVATAQQSLLDAGVAYRMAQNGGGGSAAPPAPSSAPAAVVKGFQPPIMRPPLIGGNASDPGSSAEPGDLLSELEDLISGRYSFQVFAPGSTNFGLLVTYRQQWDPITYQVGNLAKTLTLAPKETRKVTSRQTLKVERSRKQMEDNQSDRKNESSTTMRDEAEIVQRAQQKTSFSLNAKGSFNVGFADGDSTTSLGRDAEGSSQQTKRDFHESVLKAAQEFKDERKLEVETKTSVEEETTDTVEISNPNDELTVTYLFYELQRRYRVTEHIHQLTPVVLVALDVPNPNRDAIDMVLLSNAWIINRVLLDDRYRAALDYMCTSIVGDEMALQDLESNVSQVAAAVQQLTNMERDMELELQSREAALQAAIGARAGALSSKDNEGFLSEAWDAVVGSSNADPQAAQVLEAAAKDAYDRAVQEEKDLRMRLDAETAALSAATQAYAKARAEHGNRLLQIAGLRAHFKENVLFYMQAIWNFTFRDQMLFSLCNVKVPRLTATQKTYSLKVPDKIPLSVSPKPGQVVLEVDVNLQLAVGLDPATDFVTLAEIADISNPLGYIGNMAIFPMTTSNPLTDFMMVPYLDSELGIHDPDELGSWSPEDFAQYARCLLAREQDILSASDYAALQSQLTVQYQSIVSNPQVTTDTIIVPTQSLYIEALPGAHPLLEGFKLEHRAIDVQAAAEDLRKKQLESLRYAARILANDLADPDVDKQVFIEGVTSVGVNDA